jgi:transposase
MRALIAQRLEEASPFPGEVATATNSSPGVEGNGGQRRATATAPMFGLIEHDGKVHTILLRDQQPDAAPATAGAGPRLDAIVYADSHLERGALDVSGLRHQRVADSKRPPRGRPQFDSIESFWSQAKRHLQRYNGIPPRHFHLFLKECEWRYNYGTAAQLLKVLKAWIKTTPQ